MTVAVDRSTTAGAFRRIYDPSVGEDRPWYLNDHTFVHDARSGLWHLFGITHPEPADPEDEKVFAHATAPNLLRGPWTKLPPALAAEPESGEDFIWAPHVVEHGSRFWMVYAAGTSDHTAYRIHLAVSDDLSNWTRAAGNPLFTDGYDGRDPCLLRVDGRWLMYYCATSEPTGGHHVVAYREGDDLISWGQRRIAYEDPEVGTCAGPTESPFVVARDGGYYLFIGPRPAYVGTDVFFSEDPRSFGGRPIGHVEAHAAEVVQDADGAWYVSRAGWGQGGVELAELSWTS